ncbi:MAG: hypothetical protein LBD35_04110 [Prevotellaceae bacterium]|jgi:hypothetical protein|nr:hypothetical protein [Prevotellaceae bacterium]
MRKFRFADKDSAGFGLLLSTALPTALFVVVFMLLLHYRGYDAGSISAFPEKRLIPKVFSICVFPNGLIFYVYIQRNKMRTMRGMVAGTTAMAALMCVLFLIT